MILYDVKAVSIAVIDNYELAFTSAYGFCNHELNIQTTTDTVFQTASITKTINALCILRLVETGTISLTEDIRHYLKTWEFPENKFSSSQPISLMNILSHTAGLNLPGFIGYPIDTRELPTLNQMLSGSHPANNEKIETVCLPNTRHLYSGGGILLSRKIIEDRTGRGYVDLISSEVFQPLNMLNSTFDNPDEQNGCNFAAGYLSDGNPVPRGFWIYPELAPDGLWATPTDLAKLLIALQKSLTASHDTFLSQDIAKRMITPPLKTSNAALGCYISGSGQKQYIYHDGRNKGFTCEYICSISRGNGAIIMINSENDQIIPEIFKVIASIYNWEHFQYS